MPFGYAGFGGDFSLVVCWGLGGLVIFLVLWGLGGRDARAPVILGYCRDFGGKLPLWSVGLLLALE